MRKGESILQRRISLSEMLDPSSFGEVVRGFVELYRVGIKVFDERGTKISDIKIGNGDFCGYVFSFAEGRRRCTATVGRVKDGPIATSHGARLPNCEVQELADSSRGMVTVPCFTGLRYLIFPITWEGDVLGRIVFGPFYPDDLKNFPPETLTEISEHFDLTKARPLLQKIRNAPESSIVRVLLHFSQLLQTLLFMGQKMFLTSQLHIEATLDQNRELEERNRRLEDANNRLKELDRLKSAFLATVSHELRTPLTSIIGYSEMLSEGLAGHLNSEQGDYVRTIMDKGETLLKLISSILDISQIEAGKVRLHFQPMDPIELVQSSISSVRPQATKKGILLEVKAPAMLSAVSGDLDRLRQVVVNLLANAVKFTPNGGRVGVTVTDVSYQADLNCDGYRIIIEDTGVGIPADQFEKIFNSFYQVDSSSTREFGGAGIGLAIVKSFVEGHAGMVRVASEVGHGSRFTLILPCVPAQQQQLQIKPPVTPLAASIDDRF